MAGYTSQLASNCVVIDDDNAHLHAAVDPVIDGQKMSRGLIRRDLSVHPFGGLAEAEPFDIPLIPRSEWDDRIKEAEANRSHLRALCEDAGMPVLDQNGTSYCWINAPTWCVMVQRIAAGLPMVRLSPASVGAKIKNFRNQGGWGTEGLEYIARHGLVPQAQWPPNAISRSHDNAASDAERPKFKVREWWDIPRNFDKMATCLFLNVPVAIGLNWWSHEVTAMRVVSLGSGKYGCEIANSWGAGWSDKGYGVLTESKGTPDDAVAPRTVTPSEG